MSYVWNHKENHRTVELSVLTVSRAARHSPTANR